MTSFSVIFFFPFFSLFSSFKFTISNSKKHFSSHFLFILFYLFFLFSPSSFAFSFLYCQSVKCSFVFILQALFSISNKRREWRMKKKKGRRWKDIILNIFTFFLFLRLRHWLLFLPFILHVSLLVWRFSSCFHFSFRFFSFFSSFILFYSHWVWRQFCVINNF